MDRGIGGKVAVVTGASKGIGLETARRLAAAGAQVLLVARTADPLQAAAADIGAEYLAADITDPDCDARVIATAIEQLGEIDILVNNAGTIEAKDLDELTDADWQE